jgi:hypothetical protein
MTYTFKLARRLARLRDSVMIASLALAAACSAGEPTSVADTNTPPTSLAVAVAPRRVTLEPSQQARFQAYTKGSTASDSLLAAIEWTATGGTIGSDGLFISPADVGEYRVIGHRRGGQGGQQSGQLSDSAVVVIVPPQPNLASITLAPSPASVPSQKQLTFSAKGVLSDGSTADIGVEWSATGGSIDAGGTFTAGTIPGNYKVTAKAASSSVTATVPVTVTGSGTPPAPATLQSIVVSPSSVSLAPGARQLFSVQGKMSDGSQVSVTNATFSATGGSIDGSGTYTAGNTNGSYKVTAAVSASGAASLTATATVTIAGSNPPPAPAPPPSGLYANQPAGYTPIAEAGFDGVMPDNGSVSSGSGIRAGCWWRYSQQLSTATDATAPVSAPGVLKYTWSAGLPVGYSAGKFGSWDCGGTEYRGVYESGWFKLEGSSFEAPSAGMKLLGFWGVGRSDGNRVSNEVYVMTPGGTFSQFSLDWAQQGQISRRMGPNKNGSPLLKVGQWNRYEVVMTLNDIGRANGTLLVWLNGTLTHEYRDVTWRTPDRAAGFYGRSWDPIWGGMGSPPTKTKTDVMLVDHMYIAGVR